MLEDDKKFSYYAHIILSSLAVILGIVALVGVILSERRNKNLQTLPNADDQIVEKARDIANEKEHEDWFDYYYDITKNYDENKTLRYKVTYTYSVPNEQADFIAIYVLYFEGTKIVAKKLYDTRS